jgi:hypothetical protein
LTIQKGIIKEIAEKVEFINAELLKTKDYRKKLLMIQLLLR